MLLHATACRSMATLVQAAGMVLGPSSTAPSMPLCVMNAVMCMQEDLAAIISNTKRRRRSSPPASGNPPVINGRDRDRMMGDRDAG